MFVSQFKWLVWTISGTSSSDATMARRCVGCAPAVVMHIIWERDMADWLGSRTQPKHLCCSSSCITAGPNKTLGSRRTHKQTSCSNTVSHTPCKWGLCSETSGAALDPVRSVTLVCTSVAVGCIKTKNVTVLLKHVIQQAHTAVPTLSCKRDDMLLKPRRGFQSFTIIYSLFASVSTQWISILVSLRAFKQKKKSDLNVNSEYMLQRSMQIYTDSKAPIWYISLIIYTVHYFLLTYYYIIFLCLTC